MLHGRNADGIDVADGAVGEAQAGEDAQMNVGLAQVGVAFAQIGKASAIDEVEGALHLPPLVGREHDVTFGAGIQLTDHVAALQDEVLQEDDGGIALAKHLLLCLHLLLLKDAVLAMKSRLVDAFVHLVLASPCIGNPTLRSHARTRVYNIGTRERQDQHQDNDSQQRATVECGGVAQALIVPLALEQRLVVLVFLVHGAKIEVLGMVECLVEGFQGLLHITAKDSQPRQVALDDIGQLHVAAWIHGAIERLGL